MYIDIPIWIYLGWFGMTPKWLVHGMICRWVLSMCMSPESVLPLRFVGLDSPYSGRFQWSGHYLFAPPSCDQLCPSWLTTNWVSHAWGVQDRQGWAKNCSKNRLSTSGTSPVDLQNESCTKMHWLQVPGKHQLIQILSQVDTNITMACLNVTPPPLSTASPHIIRTRVAPEGPNS